MSKLNKENIKINVELDENKIPEKISWLASDAPMQNFEECKAFMLALWDKNQNNTLKVDLWTKEMQINEMNFFYYQTIHTMADSYLRATNNEAASKLFFKFANEFAEIVKLNKKS